MKELKKNWLLLIICVVLIICGIFSISYFNKVNKGKTYLNKAENYINEVKSKDYLSLDTKTNYLQTAKSNIELSKQYFKSSKQNKLLNIIDTIEKELKKKEIELAKKEVENKDKIKEINDILYKTYGSFNTTENSKPTKHKITYSQAIQNLTQKFKMESTNNSWKGIYKKQYEDWILELIGNKENIQKIYLLQSYTDKDWAPIGTNTGGDLLIDKNGVVQTLFRNLLPNNSEWYDWLDKSLANITFNYQDVEITSFDNISVKIETSGPTAGFQFTIEISN